MILLNQQLGIGFGNGLVFRMLRIESAELVGRFVQFSLAQVKIAEQSIARRIILQRRLRLLDGSFGLRLPSLRKIKIGQGNTRSRILRIHKDGSIKFFFSVAPALLPLVKRS